MNEQRLPTDPFDQTLERLKGLPNGAHTAPTVVQTTDFYGNSTQFIIQTVRTEDGDTSFITQAKADGYVRYVLPPKVLATIHRQCDANTVKVRRRNGRRIAEERKERGEAPAFLKGKTKKGPR